MNDDAAAAVKVLREIAENTSASDDDRIRAASAILDYEKFSKTPFAARSAAAA